MTPRSDHVPRIVREFESLCAEAERLSSGGTTRLRGVLTAAGVVLESILKYVSRLPPESDETLHRLLERFNALSDDRAGRLRWAVRLNAEFISRWRNVGAHDSRDLHELRVHHVVPMLHSLQLVVDWFAEEHARDEWVGRPPRLVSAPPAAVEPEGQTSLEALAGALRQAVGDQVLEDFEVEALERYRRALGLTEADAERAAEACVGRAVIRAASPPAWLSKWGTPATSAASLSPTVPRGYVLLRPGRFQMGSPRSEAGRSADETQHLVTLRRPFLLSIYPVTRASWQKLMGTMPSPNRHLGGDEPIENVSHDDAIDFLVKLSRRDGFPPAYDVNRKFEGLDATGYRLPTEAEWEYACRAGSTGATYGPLNEVAWTHRDSQGGPRPVGTRRANSWGLHDMLGNVGEWAQDWYERDYGRVNQPALDPTGPHQGERRVVRGGGWHGSAESTRAAARTSAAPAERSTRIGFRVARTVRE
jgi:sulfatase modifying factor 1